MRISLVGATGFIGRALISRAPNDLEVVSLPRAATGDLPGVDLEDVDPGSGHRFSVDDVVLILAGISSPDWCESNYELARKVNVVGTRKLISRILGSGARVIFFSTDAVYGERFESFAEEAKPAPHGAYAQMKREIEQAFEGMANFKSIRLSYVFSAEDSFTKFVRREVAAQRSIKVFEPFIRSPLHRVDVADAAIQLALKWSRFPNQFINFGGPETISREDFVRNLRRSCFPGLEYETVTPGDEFFRARPTVISMKSPLIPELLGRPPLRMIDAMNTKSFELCKEGELKKWRRT